MRGAHGAFLFFAAVDHGALVQALRRDAALQLARRSFDRPWSAVRVNAQYSAAMSLREALLASGGRSGRRGGLLLRPGCTAVCCLWSVLARLAPRRRAFRINPQVRSLFLKSLASMVGKTRLGCLRWFWRQDCCPA